VTALRAIVLGKGDHIMAKLGILIARYFRFTIYDLRHPTRLWNDS